MKIAILTLPLYGNYGGILQCYALQTVLQRMGHRVKILTKPRYGRSYFVIYLLSVCQRMVNRYIRGQKVNILKDSGEIERQNTDRFIKSYIFQYKCRNWNSKLANKFDAIVVGSDQIWRPKYFPSIELAFLSFLENTNIKRIAYAASFGVDNCEYTKEQLRTCSPLLKKFDAVSVREVSGINLCRKYFEVEAVQMLDPTLLLSADDYRALISKGNTEPSKGNMLVYILDKTPEKVLLVEKIANDKGLVPFWIDSPDEQNVNQSQKQQVKMSVEQWLRSFDDAEFVFTDSFHGSVFSIIFCKQFLVFGNQERGLSRFYSLLDLFSLNDRLILSSVAYHTNFSFIDYNLVHKKLIFLQRKADTFLKILSSK